MKRNLVGGVARQSLGHRIIFAQKWVRSCLCVVVAEGVRAQKWGIGKGKGEAVIIIDNRPVSPCRLYRGRLLFL